MHVQNRTVHDEETDYHIQSFEVTVIDLTDNNKYVGNCSNAIPARFTEINEWKHLLNRIYGANRDIGCDF